MDWILSFSHYQENYFCKGGAWGWDMGCVVDLRISACSIYVFHNPWSHGSIMQLTNVPWNLYNVSWFRDTPKPFSGPLEFPIVCRWASLYCYLKSTTIIKSIGLSISAHYFKFSYASLNYSVNLRSRIKKKLFAKRWDRMQVPGTSFVHYNSLSLLVLPYRHWKSSLLLGNQNVFENTKLHPGSYSSLGL